MCGINGIADLGAGPARDLRACIDTMNKAVAHRGPDGEGVHVEPGLVLGHRRLAIVDPGPSGAQPMHSGDGSLVLVFNGEIYNHVELGRELAAAGRVLRTRCDTEVILHAYARWGDDCVRRFNGMWAFALWDRRRRRLLCSRDRLGVKPFVYAEHEGRLWFSSEAPGLRAVLPLHRADLGKLHDFLAYGYRLEDGRTFFAGVRELPPAHHLIVEQGRLRLQRWWQLPDGGDPGPAEQRAQHLHALLADAVRLRLRSDVPVALLQSGGLDSSAIAACVEAQRAAGPGGMAPVRAFTSVHPGHPSDETALVRTLMQRLPHLQSVELQPPGEQLAELLPACVAALQEPQASATSFAHWTLMRAIRAHGVKVVLNGQGADEVLAGYGTLIAGYRLLDLALRQPRRALAEARAMHRVMGMPWAALTAQTVKAMLGRRAASAGRGWFSEGGARVLRADFRRAHGVALPELAMTLSSRNLDRHLRSQLLTYGFNQILHYQDRSSMSQGIEIRSPFIDWRLVEFAFALPDDDKFAGGRTKRLLREAFRAELPAAIVDAGRKIGFATPFDQWVATPSFRAFVKELVATPRFRGSPIWHADRLAARLLSPGSVERGFPVWRFLVVALWLQGQRITNA